MYEKFMAMAQADVDYSVEVDCINCPAPHGKLMTIMADQAAAIYITKEQCMAFYGLVEAPADGYKLVPIKPSIDKLITIRGLLENLEREWYSAGLEDGRAQQIEG